MPKQALSLWLVTVTVDGLGEETAQADERFQFSLDPDKLWVKFLEVLPGWREENKTQTMERMRIPEREFYYIRGAEFDYYRKFIDGFNEAVGRMLEAGTNAILTARAGGDAAPHLKQLDGIPAEYGVVMDRFSLLRTRLPDRWVILEAAEAILKNSAADLAAQQRASEARIRGQEEKFNNPSSTFAGSDGASAPSNRAAEALKTIFHTLEVIRNSEGTGTVSQRIAGYLKAYGGDLVSSVDVMVKAGTLHGSAGTGVIVASLGGIEGLGIRSAIDTHNLETIDGKWPGTKTVHPLHNGVSAITFTLNEKSMVNFWVDTGNLGVLTAPLSQGRAQPDIALSIGGTGLNGTEYTSNKEGRPDAGESVSLSLPAGTYTLLVRDYTDYTTASRNADEVNALHLPEVNVGINIKPYKTQRIEGRMSIPERDVTMPVSMGVAEFRQKENGTWVRKEAQDTQPLNPSKPVWVVIHGRTNSENSDNIVDLTKALYEFDQAHKGAYQVVTVDWELAAKDNSFLPPNFDPLRDATWTPAVGKWVAHQLESLGFEGKNINLIGPSHGAYVSYFAAQEFNRAGKGTVHSIIALDPAANVKLFNGPDPIDESKIRFSEVAETSLAIKAQVDEDLIRQNMLNATDAGGMAYQTSQLFEYGSDERAKTAHTALELGVPKEISRDRVHSYPTTAFAAIIRESIRQGDAGKIANSPIGLQHILATIQGLQTMNPDRQFDGTISARGYRDEVKADWWKALPIYLDLRDGEDIPLVQ